MRIFHTPDSARHDPERYWRRGTPIPPDDAFFERCLARGEGGLELEAI